MRWAAKLVLGFGLGLLFACAPPTADLKDAPVDLGNFRLGHNIVVSPDPKSLPGSRIATGEEWQAAMTKAMDDRFGRYKGDRLYHFGIAIEVYNLAAIDVPGVPTPKSALGISVTLWDDKKGEKINKKPETITVLGIFSGAGIQPTKQVQLDNLSALAAKSIEAWLLENKAWFGALSAAE